MINLNRPLLILLIIFGFSSHALVDYSEPEFKPKNSSAKRVVKKVDKGPPIKRRATRSGNKYLKVETWFESSEAKFDADAGKANFYGLHGQFQTDYNIFFDFSYWQASSSSSLFGKEAGTQKGNPEVIIGFNWLRFGAAAEAATVDLFAGMSISQKSEFASSRNDQILGVVTAKKFHDFALGLGYEHRITSDVKSEEELDIGNISTLSTSLGWVASDQIRFSLASYLYNISASNSPGGLSEGLKFSTLVPKLGLSLSPMVNLELGASFRTRRVKDVGLLRARLWGLKGAYGNSIFASFGIAI